MSCIEINSTMVKCFMVIMSLVLACPVSKAELPPTIARLPLFERAVAVIRHFEGWHGPRHHPYVGYGHRLRPGERYSHRMTKRQAEALLRKDLMERCAVFRPSARTRYCSPPSLTMSGCTGCSAVGA